MNTNIFKNFRLVLTLLAITPMIFSSCKDDEVIENEPDVFTGYMASASHDSADISVDLISQESELTTGYNNLELKFYQTSTGDKIHAHHIEIIPMMDMGQMMHSCPTEQANSESHEGMTNFQTVFIMPSTETGKWMIKVNFEDHDGNLYKISIPIKVMPSEPAQLIRAMDTAKTPYFISIVPGKKFEVGENDIEITIHKKSSMMSFPAVEDLTLEIKPWMPTMGHGSPNNVAPVHQTNGHYKGKVNFTMTGFWEIEFQLKKDGEAITAPIVFEHTL